MISFGDSELGLEIAFTDRVIANLMKYRQTKLTSLEASGLLFSDLDSSSYPRVIVSGNSSPSKYDKRSRRSVLTSPAHGQKIIDRKFIAGHHYVGEWHTHPEPFPRPSPKDLSTARSLFLKSDHCLRYLLIVIVGTGDDFKSSFVGLLNETQIHRLAVTD